MRTIIFLFALSGISIAARSEPLIAGPYAQQIETIAARSACTRYSWKNRGRAPVGYIKGVALSFARSICRLSSTQSVAAQIMSAADTNNRAKDAVSHYRAVFSSNGIKVNASGIDTMRAVYVLGLGLGISESSGQYCEGWDKSAGSNRPASTGEAGAFQTSYDLIGAHPELQRLYDEYRASSERCLLEVFNEDVNCQPRGPLGSGPAADYQVFNKICPAFATEYAMTLLRLRRAHWGPITRHEAEVKTTCYEMLEEVQRIVVDNLTPTCRELL